MTEQLMGDPKPPRGHREMARTILVDHGISGRGAASLAGELSESVYHEHIRGLLSIQRPPGYKSALDILAEHTPNLVGRANFRSTAPDFSTDEELQTASLDLRHMDADAEGFLEMNRKRFEAALNDFVFYRKTPPYLKAVLRGEQEEVLRNAQVALLLATLTAFSYREAYRGRKEYEVLERPYERIEQLARNIARNGTSLPDASVSFANSPLAVEAYRSALILSETVGYEGERRTDIHRANDVILGAYQIANRPDAFVSSCRQFYKEAVGLDIDEAAQLLKN